MQVVRRWVSVVLVATLSAGGCARDQHDDYDNEAEDPQARPAEVSRQPPARPAIRTDSAEVRARIAAERDSVRAAFRRVRALQSKEAGELRRDLNAEQIATARSLGVRASGEAEIEQLRRQGRLVPLGDSTPYWVLRKMQHSVPYVTPDTRAMLVELGRRFHARLDSLRLPHYRMKVTSVLRTDETQAELRKVNPNASQTVSAHEFGTTLDVSHARFAAPDPGNEGAPELRQMQVEMLEELGKEHAQALQAELGRAIVELRSRDALQVMMEDRQPVYHMTVARRSPAAD